MDPGRQAILDALATVEGLEPSPLQPASVVAGTAWPVWTRDDWRNGCITTSEYTVFVALPAGATAATIEQSDALRHTTGEALWKAGRVVESAAYEIPVEPGQQAIPVLRYLMEV